MVLSTTFLSYKEITVAYNQVPHVEDIFGTTAQTPDFQSYFFLEISKNIDKNTATYLVGILEVVVA